MSDKAALRRRFTVIRDAIDNREEKSARIAARLLQSDLLCNIHTVLLYLSFRSEPDTHFILTELMRRGIRIAVPYTHPDHTMDAIRITEPHDLVPGRYGILEPNPKKIQNGTLPILSKAEIDLVLLPGLAFDRFGCRLGYGGGYYDRYLKDFHGFRAALSFSACLTERLPHDAHDIHVQAVITEDAWISTVPQSDPV